MIALLEKKLKTVFEDVKNKKKAEIRRQDYVFLDLRIATTRVTKNSKIEIIPGYEPISAVVVVVSVVVGIDVS